MTASTSIRRTRRTRNDAGLRVLLIAPAPGISKPEMREDAKGGRFGAAIVSADAHHDVLRGLLRVLDFDIEVAVVVEDAGVE